MIFERVVEAPANIRKLAEMACQPAQSIEALWSDDNGTFYFSSSLTDGNTKWDVVRFHS